MARRRHVAGTRASSAASPNGSAAEPVYTM
jgi:hypothetical protein